MCVISCMYIQKGRIKQSVARDGEGDSRNEEKQAAGALLRSFMMPKIPAKEDNASFIVLPRSDQLVSASQVSSLPSFGESSLAALIRVVLVVAK